MKARTGEAERFILDNLETIKDLMKRKIFTKETLEKEQLEFLGEHAFYYDEESKHLLLKHSPKPHLLNVSLEAQFDAATTLYQWKIWLHISSCSTLRSIYLMTDDSSQILIWLFTRQNHLSTNYLKGLSLLMSLPTFRLACSMPGLKQIVNTVLLQPELNEQYIKGIIVLLKTLPKASESLAKEIIMEMWPTGKLAQLPETHFIVMVKLLASDRVRHLLDNKTITLEWIISNMDRFVNKKIEDLIKGLIAIPLKNQLIELEENIKIFHVRSGGIFFRRDPLSKGIGLMRAHFNASNLNAIDALNNGQRIFELHAKMLTILASNKKNPHNSPAQEKKRKISFHSSRHSLTVNYKNFMTRVLTSSISIKMKKIALFFHHTINSRLQLKCLVRHLIPLTHIVIQSPVVNV